MMTAHSGRMADKYNNLKDWAAKRPPSGRCLTCRDDIVCNLVREYIRLVQGGETNRSLSSFHVWLCEAHGYELTYSALRNHVTRCEGLNIG